MKDRFLRIFRLRPGESRLVFTMGFLLLANSLALSIVEIVSVSGFISEVGVEEFLLVWIADMALLMLTTGLQSLIVDRFERVAFLRWMTLLFAIIYVILRLFFVFGVPSSVTYTALFLLVDQQFIFFPLIFWILANDTFDMAQAKRLFPVIASFRFVGRIGGFGIAAVAPAVLDRLNIPSAELLSVVVVVYLIAFVVISRGLRNINVRKTVRRKESVREALTEGWGFIREVPSFRFLILAMAMLAVGFTIVEYYFFVVSNQEIASPDDFQTFYSLYSLGFTVLAIVMQSLFTSRIINRLNLKNVFMVFPISLLIGAGLIALGPSSIYLVIAGLAFPRLLKETIDQSARSSLQALVPEERRGRVSMFMDSYLFAGGAIIGSVLAGIFIWSGQAGNALAYSYLSITGVCALSAIWFTYRMRGVYDTSLLNWRLKRRKRGSDVLSKLEF
ncbi:MAG: MFS transporter [Chloroflexi bacterium]|nr:MFS transporter [Chloroflexota bacterium]